MMLSDDVAKTVDTLESVEGLSSAAADTHIGIWRPILILRMAASMILSICRRKSVLYNKEG